MTTDNSNCFDVVVVGAGLSGIAAGHYLQTLCADRSYVILDSRAAIGGTWDLFRYPGVRSDSDMFTLGYSFRPWASDSTFASGAAIRDYVADTARAEGIARHIRFGHRVTDAAWCSQQARWTVTTTTADGTSVQFSCRFLFFCSGYYNYTQGHNPRWTGREDFAGQVVHPQHWPEGLDCTGKRVVVIGSGATAVTLVPALATTAAHVTMVQRSPSYIVAMPGRDHMGAALRRMLPTGLSHRLIRWKNIALAMAVYQFSRWRPAAMRRLILRHAQRRLGPDFDVQRHLAPAYQPWDQRLCVAPDADIFKAIQSGRASIVTGAVERFTPGGVRLATGEDIAADVIVTATGLQLQVLGGAALTADGVPVDMARCVVYRGAMYSGIPNLALASGYTNASWTLKCELVARYVCRVLNELRARQLDICMPVAPDTTLPTQPFLDLSAGYVQRSAHLLARQGTRRPWRMYQNYLADWFSLRFSPLRDGVLRFSAVARPALSSGPDVKTRPPTH